MRLYTGLYLLLALSTHSAIAQSYTFFRLVGQTTPRPDGLGPIALNVNTRPAVEGNYVVFRDYGFFGSVNAQAIWSCNINDGTFIKLVDQSTPVPGGTGNFTDLVSDSQPLLKNGVVTFLARDSKAPPINQGIYRVPVTGGAVTRVVNYNSPDPTGGTFTSFDTFSKPYGGFTVDQRIAFYGNNAANLFGVYTANPDGSSITRIADVPRPVKPNTGAPISIFLNPSTSAGTVLFYGQTVFDPSTGFNALYTSPVTGPTGTLPDGSPNYVEVINSNTALPGNPNANGHTRLGPQITLEGSTVAFIADDSNSSYRGIFTIPAGGGAVTRVVAPGVTLPGISQINTISSFGSFAVNGGRILFRAEGPNASGATTHGLYMWQNGAITPLLQTGDLLDGRRVQEIFDVGIYGWSGNRFGVVLSLVGYGGALYVAQPSDPAIRISAVANSASYASQSISPGEIVTLFGANIGPPSLTTFQLNSTNRVPASLANTRFIVNGNSAPPLYVRADQGSAIVPFALNEPAASVVALFNGNVSTPFSIPVTDTVGGLFSADSTGRGQGAILNENGSVNSASSPAAKGSTIVLFGTGHGATNPSLEAGQVTPTANIPGLWTRPSITIGGQPAQIAYAGPAPGLVAGVLQMNVVVPATVASGNQPVVIKFNTDTSPDALTVAIQ